MVELDAAQREAALAKLRATDPSLADQVAVLLAADAAETLAAPISREARRVAEEQRVGQQVGGFRLGELIGRGGMGVVYRAERIDDFEQTVAIKFLPRSLQTPDLIRRFVSERAILAQLEHPYIARVIDGGTSAQGEPYLVMEYVRGEAIDAYCDNATITIAERLRLFVAVCAAVSHAHGALVVHRDIKPSNILVTVEGVPRLLDFGVANLLSHEGAETSGDGLTRRYASPEQLAGKAVGTGTDVYSLGVVLAELCGDPADMEVRAIIDKARATQSTDRYSSVSALARDIERYLAGAPISVFAHRRGYRLRKFAHRHRVAGVAAVLLLGASLFYVDGLRRAQLAADAEARKATRVASFMEQLFEDVDPGQTKGSEITASQLLQQGADRVRADFAADPDVQARLFGVIGRTWRRLGSYKTAKTLHETALTNIDPASVDAATRAHMLFDLAYADYEMGLLADALKNHTEALDLRRELHVEDHPSLADSLRETALMHQLLDDLELAQPLYEQARAMYERLGDNTDYHAVGLDLAMLQMQREDFATALTMARHAYAAQVELHGPVHPETALGSNNIGVILGSMGRNVESIEWQRRSVDIRTQLYGANSPKTLFVGLNLSNSLWGLGHVVEALEVRTQVQPDLLQATAGTADSRRYPRLTDTAKLLMMCQEYDEAMTVAQALDAWRSTTKAPFPNDLAMVDETMGRLLYLTGRHAQAAPRFERSMETLRKATALQRKELERVEIFAELNRYRMDPAPATLPALAARINAQNAARGRLHIESALYFDALAELFMAAGNSAQAEVFVRRTLAAADELFAADSIERAHWRLQASARLLQLGLTQNLAALLDHASGVLETTRAKARRHYRWFDRLDAEIARQSRALSTHN